MKYAAILFDKDGTLFDFRHTWEAWAKAALSSLSDGDPSLAAVLADAIGFEWHLGRYRPDSIAIAGSPSEIAAVLAPHLPTRDIAEVEAELNRMAAAAPQREVVPLNTLFETLRARGLRLGVMTNDSEAAAREHLGQARVIGQLDFVAGSDSGYGAKPDAAPLFAFARTVNIEPGRCLMIGDSTHDLIAGRAAGMTTVGVLTGIAERAELLPYADVVLGDLGDLIAWLEAQQER